MKKILFIGFILLGCSKNDPKLTGCVTGKNKITGTIESMGCWRKSDYLSGSHAISYWNSYTNQQWQECSTCN